ncbi:hypothetical protein [Candidatus Nitrososphaera gargensis]|nr:hypothetical protein [Candidatus Nitrososphaera gargensis]
MTNEHSILGIYKKVFDYLAAGFAIIYGVEMDGNNVKRKMAKLNETVLNKSISNGSLIIVDRPLIYAGRYHNPVDWSKNSLAKSILEAKHVSLNIRGIIIFVNPQIELETGNYKEEPLDFENFVGKRFNIPIEVVYCYDLKVVLSLKPSILLKILKIHHLSTIDTNSIHHTMPNKVMMEVATIFEQGLVDIFGKDASELIFKTLSILYGIDKHQIPLKLDIVEQKLENAIGRFNASRVFSAINLRLINECLH